MERVLVTGGAGFIGSHLVDKLLEIGYAVRILDLLTKPVHMHGKPSYLSDNAEFLLGDVRDKQTLEKAMMNVDYIFHLAAYQDYFPNFSKFFHTNVVSTALIYEIIVERKLDIKRIIIASSQMVAGEGQYVCDEHGLFLPEIRSLEKLKKRDWEHRCPVCGIEAKNILTSEFFVAPPNSYGISKFNQEQISMVLGKRYKIPSVALRYSIVQGARQSFYNAYSGVCRIFSLSYFFNRQPIIYEDGKSIRDYVNIKDVIEANILVMKDDRAEYQIFNVGGNKGYSVLEFCSIVAEVFGKNMRAKIPFEFRFGDTRHQISDTSKLKELGWNANFSPMDSVQEYKEYLESQKNLEDVLNFATKQMKQSGVVLCT